MNKRIAPLPVVDRSTVNAVLRKLDQLDDDDRTTYLTERLAEIERYNPMLTEYLVAEVTSMRSEYGEEAALAAVSCSIALYTMLDEQVRKDHKTVFLRSKLFHQSKETPPALTRQK